MVVYSSIAYRISKIDTYEAGAGAMETQFSFWLQDK